MRTFHLADFDRHGFGIAIDRQMFQLRNEQLPHLHDCTEVVCVLRGGGVNSIDGVNEPLIAGDFYVVPHGSVHQFFSTQGLEFYNLMFNWSLFSAAEMEVLRSRPGFAAVFESRGRTGGSVFSDPSGEISRRCGIIAEELDHGGASAALTAKAALLLLIAAICDRCSGKNSRVTLGGALEDTVMRRILTELHRDPGTEISVSKVASRVHLSATYVNEFFRLRTGIPLIKYRNMFRIAEAGRLLAEDETLPVSEVSRRCGFADSGYFSRVFKREAGMTPRRYRQEILRKKNP